jgi:Spy/CpxP family protein refolding chaperone
MKALFIDGASDEELKKLHASIESNQSSRSTKKLNKMIFLKNLLTKEQRKTYIEKGQEKRKHRRHKRRKGDEEN